MKITEHFTFDEMKCRCGKCDFSKPETTPAAIMANLLLLCNRLEEVRSLVNQGLEINSGLRCPAHNAATDGKPNSPHLQGYAADINCITGLFRYRLKRAAYHLAIRRIGTMKDAIHMDVAPAPWPQDVEWHYYQEKV